MPELFVPPSKSVVTAEIAVSETVSPWPSESFGEEPLAEGADGQPGPTLLTAVDILFFYGRSDRGDPVLYQVNVAEGSLALVSEPPALFPTALDGLLAAEPTIAPWLEPESPEPESPESEAPELEALESESSELEAPESESPESKALEPTSLEPKALPIDLKPETLEPKFLEIETLEPKALEPKALEPETLESHALEPEALPTALEPETLEPKVLPTDSLGMESTEVESPAADQLTMPPAAAEAMVFTLVQGTDAKNFLIGSAADNALFGFGGDDLILTAGGNNLAFGGAGNDTIIGGPGDDILFGGAGNDVIEGGAGNDHLFGGDGDDILYGGAGANVLVGAAGADIFRLGTPGAYGGALVGATELDVLPDTIVDFSIAEGDRLDFSLIAAQPAFAGVELLPFLSFVQVEANTEVQVTTPLGQTTTEAILLDVEADTITPSSLSFTTPAGLPLLK